MIVVEQGGAAKRLLSPAEQSDLAVDDPGNPRVLVRTGVETTDNLTATIGLAANCKDGIVLEVSHSHPRDRMDYSPVLQVSLSLPITSCVTMLKNAHQRHESILFHILCGRYDIAMSEFVRLWHMN